MAIYTISITDPDSAFVALCQETLEPDGFDVQVAEHTLPTADLVILTWSSEAMDTLHTLKTEQPVLPVIITLDEAATLPASDAATLLAFEEITLLTKPTTAEQLLQTVEQALQVKRGGLVTGNLRDFSLTSLISVICNEGKRAALDVWHDTVHARLFFEKGEVVHAETDTQQGEEAVYTALTWEYAPFRLTMGQTTSERTITISWSGLVLEGLRRIDEAGFDQELLEPTPSDIKLPAEFDEATPMPTRPTSVTLDSETQERVEERMQELFTELAPRYLLLASHSGRLIHLQGNIERHNALALAALVAGSFSAVGEIAEIVAHDHEEQAFHQSLQEGKDVSLYSAQVGKGWTLAVAFDPTVPLGLARQLTLRTAEKLETLLAQAKDASEQRKELSQKMNENFMMEVSDALGDLFD